jgi:predicted transcriptional regulator
LPDNLARLLALQIDKCFVSADKDCFACLTDRAAVKKLVEQTQFMETPMSSAKDVMVEIITQQPEDSSYDEILRELAYARMVQRGLADSDNDRTLSNSEVLERIESWQK